MTRLENSEGLTNYQDVRVMRECVAEGGAVWNVVPDFHPRCVGCKCHVIIAVGHGNDSKTQTRLHLLSISTLLNITYTQSRTNQNPPRFKLNPHSIRTQTKTMRIQSRRNKHSTAILYNLKLNRIRNKTKRSPGSMCTQPQFNLDSI